MIELNWKVLTLIAVWSIVCTASIVTIVMYTHEASTNDMRAKVDELTSKMECKGNSCDRFNGKDARAMEARLNAEIKDVRKDCGCDK